MQLLEPCAFLPRNGDDYFSRKSPMRIWCNDSQYIFARAMIFLMKICHFHTKCQFYSKKTKGFQDFNDFEGRAFRGTFLMRCAVWSQRTATRCHATSQQARNFKLNCTPSNATQVSLGQLSSTQLNRTQVKPAAQLSTQLSSI